MSYKNILDLQTAVFGLLNDVNKIQSIQEDIINRLDHMDYRLSNLENGLTRLQSYLTKD